MSGCRIAAFALALYLSSVVLTAQDPPSSKSAGTISVEKKPVDALASDGNPWQLQTVPATDLPKFLEQHADYVALPRTVWNAWFQKVTKRETAPAEIAQDGPRLTSLEWQAEFNGRNLSGELALQIAAGDKPQLLALEPWPFSMSSAAWRDSKDPVVIGNDAHGLTKVLVSRSGTLAVPVELSGQTQGDEQVFQWTGPQSLARRLILTVGEQWVASSDDGVLVERTVVAGKKERSIWQAAGPHPLTIRLTPRTVNANPLIVMRPKVTYELGTRGLDLLWEGRWEQFDRAPEKILLQIDPALQVQDVMWGEQTLPFKLGTALPSGALPLEIAIPQRASTTSPTLRIQACAPVVTDQLASLPQIRTPNVIMQDGSWNILALSPYRIDQIETRECRVTQSEKLTTPLQGDALKLQTTGKSPDVQLLTRWQKPRGTWRSALTINNQDREPRGVWCGEVVLDEGHANLIQFSVDSSWIVESVECEPAALVRSWQRIERVTGRTLYRLHLKRDLQPREALRLTFRARTPNRASVVRIEPEQFDLVVPLEFERERSYISVALGDEYETEFLGTGEPRRLDPRDLPPGDLALLTSAARGKLYRWSGVASGWGLRLMPRPARVKARLETKLELTDEGAIESYRIHCQNAVQQNGKLTLNFSRAQNEIVQWTLEATREPLSAKRVITELVPQLNTELDPQKKTSLREQWDVDLPDKPGEDFVLVGQRKLAFDKEYQPALLSLSNIQDQSGTLRFFSSADNAPAVEMGNLALVPLPEEIETVSGELARWSYAVPANDDDQARAPVLKRGSAANPAARVVIWSATLETLIQPENAANQQLTLLLENAGQDRWSFELPAGTSGLAVFLNERLVIPRTSHDQPRLVQLELDPRQRHVQLRLNWRGDREQHAWKITAQPQWPKFPEPPLSRRWLIWTTAGYTPMQRPAAHTPVQQDAKFWTGPGLATAQHEWWLTSQLLANTDDDAVAPATVSALAGWWQRWHGKPRPLATWREHCAELWHASFAADKSERTELAVDVRALAMLGIAADEAVQPTQIEIFQREAVLISGPRGWLLTTRMGLMSWTGLQPLPETMRAYAVTESARYTSAGITPFNRDAAWAVLAVPLNRWGMNPSLGMLPWPWTGGSPVDLGIEWIPHLVDLDLLDEPIPFVELRQTYTLAFAIFAGCLGASVWWVVRSSPTKILTGGILFACIALLPNGIQILGAAALAGLAAGQALRWLGWWPWYGWIHRRATRPSISETPRRATVYATSIVLLAILAAMATSRWSWSIETNNVAVNGSDEAVWTVYSPVDEEGVATGDVVYVPPAMAAAIAVRNAKLLPSNTEDEWLIRSAKYIGQVIRPADERPRSGNWLATIQIQTLTAAQWVRLPYSAHELVVLPDGIRVDGESGEWRWTEKRDELELFISTAGSHRLEIKFLPLTADRMSAELGFTLPSSPFNEFELSAPANLPLEYELPGRWKWQPEQQQLQGVCGELQRFEIGWPKYDELQSSTAQVEIEIAQWLRVQPALTTLEVRIPIRVLNGRLAELELAVDERLRLLRHRGDAGVAWKAEQKGRSLKLNFVRPLQDRGTVELTFLVDSFSGLGTLSLPRCEILGHTVKAQWLFGAVDPSLEYHEQGTGAGMRAIDQSMVQRVWGGDPGRPMFAYQLLRPNLPWKLVTQPREPVVQSTTSEAWLSAAHDQIEWGCQTQIDISNGSLLILRGKLTEEWLPERVIVRQQQQELTQRWSIGTDRQISIFLESPLYGEASILLLGKRALPAQTNAAWNWPQWHGHLPRSAQLLFERDAGTLFRLAARPNWTEVPREDWSKQLATWPKEYRQVNKLAAVERLPQALWSGKPVPQPIPLRLVPNHPTGALELSVELIQREKNNWRALVHLHGSLKSGQIDRLELALPPTCRDIKIDKDLATAMIEQDAAQERTLVLRPTVALSGEWDLKWEHRLEYEPGQPVSWPHLRPRTNLALRQFAILPNSEESRSPVWRINGLKQIEFDQAHAALAQGRGSQLYKLGEGPPWAEYLPHRAGDTTPEVVLASHSLGRQDSAQVIGVSTWDLLPEGASRVILALPADCELLQGRVDGLNLTWRKLTSEELQARLAERAAEIVITSNNPLPTAMYEVTLVNQFIPQRLSAVYRYTVSSKSEVRNVSLPTVWNLAVRKSRLQFWQPVAADSSSQELAGHRNWDEALTLDYLQVGALLQPALQANNEVTQSWRQLWERRFRIQSQHLLVAQLDTDQTEAAKIEPEAESKQQTQLADLRKLHGISSEASIPRLSADDVWRAFGLPQTSANYRVVHGTVPVAELAEPALPAHDWRRLALLLAAGLLSATMLALVAARTGWGNWPGRHPTASLLVASLLWLIYLQPREFAILLAVLAILTWAVKRRATRALDPTDFELVPAK
jgi:hypothetical protein